MQILYEDNHIIVAVKPPNMPSQPDASGDGDMTALVKAYIKETKNKPGDAYLGLVHRLDRPVGGVMVFARTSKAAGRLTEQFKTRRTVKRYCALVDGAPCQYARLEGYIAKNEATGDARMVEADEAEREKALAASLEYYRIGERGLTTLIDIRLFTGRHHQIRCQLANECTPIWGDARYNPRAKVGQKIALWAYSLEFDHPTRKTADGKPERMRFCAMPEGRAWEGRELELSALMEGARINYFDKNVLAVEKEAGVHTTVIDADEAGADGGDSLEGRLKRALGKDKVFPLHRLDVPTSGLVLFARSSRAADALKEAISEHAVSKFYTAIVSPPPQRDHAALVNYLIKDEKAARVRVYDEMRDGAMRESAKEASLFYKTERTKNGAAQLNVELFTGRTHQIRAQLAHIGSSVLGDDKYSGGKAPRLMLHATKLEFHLGKGEYEYLNAVVLTSKAPFEL